MKNYVVPKEGATVTIFAPYDCKNKCPFCINKKDYDKNPDYYKPNIYQVFDSISVMDNITPNCDFVITGGEPFADFEKLKQIIEYISNKNKKGSKHKIFINTTAPWSEVEVEQINSLKNYITGINISRHITKYVSEGDDKLIWDLRVPVRINCVLMTKVEAEQAREFKYRFSTCRSNSSHYPITGIQFRDNYIDVGWKNLYNMRTNEIYNATLKSFLKYEPNCPESYITKMESFRWTATIQNGKFEAPVYFHRTMEKSKIENDKIIEINDVIIRPNGKIMDDWNEHGQELDLEAYKEGVAANDELQKI